MSLAEPVSKEDLMRSNTEQRVILTAVLSTCRRILIGDANVSPCHLIVAGTAGTGKTFVLKSATALVQRLFGTPNAVRVAAPSGSAAAQVGGCTIHSLFGVHGDHESKDDDGVS